MARLELAAERVEVLGQQLAAIGEMIHFLHEQALSPADPLANDISPDVEQLLGDLGEHELALHELDALPA